MLIARRCLVGRGAKERMNLTSIRPRSCAVWLGWGSWESHQSYPALIRRLSAQIARFRLMHRQRASGVDSLCAFPLLEEECRWERNDMLGRCGGDEAAAIRAEDAYWRSVAALVKLKGKLDAVFDDLDAEELLASSRHAKLAAVHPNMPMVPRRTLSEGIEYVLRGEPVVITDAFEEEFDPVAHRWTLDYLNGAVFGSASANPPRFGVAADLEYRCCQPLETWAGSRRNGYPYPFAPTTHPYLDTFGGFVESVRESNRDAVSVDSGTWESPVPRLVRYLEEKVMNQDGEVSVDGGVAPPRLVADVEATADRLRPLALKQPFFGDYDRADLWLGQRGVVEPLRFDDLDNLYVVAWGRTRATIGEPGQLERMYRYPNGHPLMASSRVNLTDPDLDRFPAFEGAKLREVAGGPGDVLYLPAWWWRRFERPFEDGAALTLRSRDADEAPPEAVQTAAVRDYLLADQLEETVAILGGEEAGFVLDALAKDASGGGGSASDDEADREWLERGRAWMMKAAEDWTKKTSDLPGKHPWIKRSAAELVDAHLARTHRGVLREGVDGAGAEWRPGTKWDLSRMAKLPPDLEKR
ncbi:hypothetical protein ACHAWF_010603 [Thalassiosira exigua]